MILKNSQSPSKSLYVIGGQILKLLKSHNFASMSPLLLYELYNKEFESISYAYLIYGLDWLFIAGYIKLSDSGDILLCN